MLRSSRKQADALFVGMTVLLTLFLFVAGVLPAQDTTSADGDSAPQASDGIRLAQAAPANGSDPDIPATAVLLFGPEFRRGIDLLAPDLTRHWYGRYRIGGARVDLYFIRSPLDRASGWQPAPCPLRDLRRRDGTLYYHADPSGWSLLTHLVAGELPPTVTVCEFVDRFVDRHLLFENFALVQIPGEAPVFPAIIQL